MAHEVNELLSRHLRQRQLASGVGSALDALVKRKSCCSTTCIFIFTSAPQIANRVHRLRVKNRDKSALQPAVSVIFIYIRLAGKSLSRDALFVYTRTLSNMKMSCHNRIDCDLQSGIRPFPGEWDPCPLMSEFPHGLSTMQEKVRLTCEPRSSHTSSPDLRRWLSHVALLS